MLPEVFIPHMPTKEALSGIPTARKMTNQRRHCMDKWGWNCVYCRTALNIGSVTFEHVVPRSKGGGRSNNLVPACVRCNMLRGNFSSVAEFDALVTQVRPIIQIAEDLIKGKIKSPNRG